MRNKEESNLLIEELFKKTQSYSRSSRERSREKTPTKSESKEGSTEEPRKKREKCRRELVDIVQELSLVAKHSPRQEQKEIKKSTGCNPFYIIFGNTSSYPRKNKRHGVRRRRI